MYAIKFTTVGVLLLTALFGCGRLAFGETARVAHPQLKVAATIFPLYDLVRNVVGSEVDVVLLVPPGASPHTFAVRPSTIQALTGSTAIFAIGHGLDDWVANLARGVGVERTIMVDSHVAMRSWNHERHGHGGQSHHRGTVDPHYWLAISNARRMVQNIAEALGRLDPTNRTAYGQRATAYRERLHALDHEIRQLFAGLPRHDMATLHPAFGYFAEAYALHVVASFTSSPGREPAPRQVETFLRQLQAHDLDVLFVEPQLPQSPLHGLARDLGVALKELDPLGGGAGRESYMAMMRFNATQIAASLRE